MEERRDDNFIWPLQTLLRHSCPFLQHLRSYAESGRSHQDFSLGPVAFTGWVSSNDRKCIVGLDLSAHACNPSLGRYMCGGGRGECQESKTSLCYRAEIHIGKASQFQPWKNSPSRRCYERPAFRVHLPMVPWDFLHRISAC